MFFFLLFLLSFVSSTEEFVLTKTTVLNGHTYHEVRTQPWFRAPHDVHTPVALLEIANSTFGKHRLPENDIFKPHNWTKEEEKYLPCRTLVCACPLFKGRISGGKCILPNGSVLQRARRSEIRALSDEERSQIFAAFNKLKESGVYDRIGLVHKYSGVHEGPGFFTWHREFLKRVELLLRRELPVGSNLGIPYWDSSLEAFLNKPNQSLFFSDSFMGSSDEKGVVVDGPLKHWKNLEGAGPVRREVGKSAQGEPLNDARIDFVLNMTRVEQVLAAVLPLQSCPITILDERLLEYSHDYVHEFILGDMTDAYSSSGDLLFYLHHSMIDNIWELWRQKVQTRTQRESDYPPSLANCYPEKHFAESKMNELDPYTNRDALSNAYTDSMYEYAPRPSCKSEDSECGSKYLFCMKSSDKLSSKCQAKIKDGGSCASFERWNICYDHSVCFQGQCIMDPEKIQLEM